jgi:hypothetical protein
LGITNLPAVARWSRLAVAVLALAGFVSFKLSEALSGAPLVWQDSESYEKVASAGWFSSGLWTGARPPLIPVLWKVTGTPTSFVVVQTCVSIACWTALAFAVARGVPVGWWRPVAVVAVFALATTEPVRLWDHSILSETMALSLLALLSALLLLVAERASWPRIAGAAVAGLLFAATRDTGIFTVLVLGIAFAAYSPMRPRHVRRRALALAGVLAAAAALPLGLEVVSHRGDVNVRDDYYVRVFGFPDRVAWFSHHGMPQAQQVDDLSLAQGTTPGHVAVVVPDMNDPKYRPLYAWLRSDGARTYLQWLAVHPGYVLTAPFKSQPEAFNNGDGSLDFYAGAETSTNALDRVFGGPWWYATGVAAAALVIAALGGVLPQRGWQLAALLALVGAASAVAAWHGEGQEVTRHTVEGDVQLRLGLLAALLFSVPAWWRRYGIRRGNRAPARWKRS